jgi:hypothetical protein
VTSSPQQTDYISHATQKWHSLETIAPCVRRRNDYVRMAQIDHCVLVVFELSWIRNLLAECTSISVPLTVQNVAHLYKSCSFLIKFEITQISKKLVVHVCLYLLLQTPQFLLFFLILFCLIFVSSKSDSCHEVLKEMRDRRVRTHLIR